MAGLLPRDLFEFLFDITEPELRQGVTTRISMPRINMYEEKDTLFIQVEAPGFEEKDITISITNNTLRISGQKSAEKKQKGRRYFVNEITKASFTRIINLPYPIDEDKAEAYFENGILTIKLPKLTEKKKGVNIIPIKKK